MQAIIELPFWRKAAEGLQKIIQLVKGSDWLRLASMRFSGRDHALHGGTAAIDLQQGIIN